MAVLRFLTSGNEFRYYSADGTLINTAQLRSSADFATSPEGQLLVYSRGGLWQVDANGEWSLYIDDAPPGGNSASILMTQEILYLYNGNRLHAYNRERALLWEAGTPPVRGLSDITTYNNILLISSNHGDIFLVNDGGSFCNRARIFGAGWCGAMDSSG